MRRRRHRRQRVALRHRRREKIKERFQGWMLRGAAGALAAGLSLGIITQSDSLFGRFLSRHTPAVEVRAPQALAGPPLSLDWPSRRYWLWAPGVSRQAGRRLRRKNPAVQTVRFEKNFSANRIVAWIEPRRPLVRWDTIGMDREGAVFPILPGSWSQLPRAEFGPGLARPALARWVVVLAADEPFWSQVSAVGDDGRGHLWIDLKTGARIQWGPPEPEEIPSKLAALSKVLQDAHAHLGGAAQADLRFFDQGRIIVRPKSAR